MAAGGFNITVNGDKELQKILSRANVTSGEIRSISRRAGNVIKNQARKNIKNFNFKDSTGQLAESIVVKGSKRYAGVWVGPAYSGKVFQETIFQGEIAGTFFNVTREKTAFGKHFHLVAFDFIRSDGKRSTSNPIGQVVQEAAALKRAAIRSTLAKGYGTLLKRKLRKL